MLRFFAKVARLSPGYNMHFVGCLRKKGVGIKSDALFHFLIYLSTPAEFASAVGLVIELLR